MDYRRGVGTPEEPVGELEKATARQRSLEAELASDAAAAVDPATPASHHLAVELHTEAARWSRKVGATRRAYRHETWAKIHAQLAARLVDDD